MKMKKAPKAGDKPAIPLNKETEQAAPLPPIQQAAYSAAIFATPSSD